MNLKYSKKRRKNTKLKALISAILLILFVFIIIDRIQENTVSKDELTLIVQNEDITNNLVDNIIVQNNTVYLSFEDIKNVFDKTLYTEQETNLIITTSGKKVAAIAINAPTLEINGATVEIEHTAFQTEDGKIYMPLSELINVYDIELKYSEDTKNIIVDYYSKSLKTAEVTTNSKLKNSKSVFSKTIEKIKKDDKVVYISEKDGWAKVRTQNGMIGYIKNKKLKNITTIREDWEENTNTNNAEYMERNLTNVEMKNYAERKNVANKMLAEVISENKKCIKIIYEGNKDNLDFTRFKIEATPIFKECGIAVIW